MKNFFSIVSIIFLSICMACTGVYAWGPSTHNAIALAAKSIVEESDNIMDWELYDVIERFPGAYKAGSIFPDTMLVHARQMAFWIHHLEFIDIETNYFLDNFSAPYNDEALRILCHFMGTTTHIIADNRWHGDSEHPYTALHQCIENDLPGNPLAESIIEAGIDLFTQRYDLHGDDDLSGWFIPAVHLEKICRDNGWGEEADVNRFVENTQFINVAVWFTDQLWEYIFDAARIVLPWTHDHYRELPYGGLFDVFDASAARISEEWVKINIYQDLWAKGSSATLMPGNLNYRQLMLHHNHRHHHFAGCNIPFFDKAITALERGIIRQEVYPVPGGYELGNIEIIDAEGLADLLSEYL